MQQNQEQLTQDPQQRNDINYPIVIKLIIRDQAYLTEIVGKQDYDDIQNPLLPAEETTSQLIDSIFASSNLRSQKLSKMVSSSGNTKQNGNAVMGSLFRSGCSSYTVTDEENDQIYEAGQDRIHSFPDGELKNESDFEDLKPPKIMLESDTPTYDELKRKCIYLENCFQSEKKQRQRLASSKWFNIEISAEQQRTIESLQQIEKAAYEQIDIRIQEITDLETSVKLLQNQVFDLKQIHQDELKMKDLKINELNKQLQQSSTFQQANAMLQIKEKQIQLLQGQLASLRATQQYRSQGSYHSNASYDKCDKNVVNHIINNNNNNQIIIKTEVNPNNIKQFLQKTKATTPKKQPQPNQDSQSTQRSKKGQTQHSKSNSREQPIVPSWLDHLKKKNDDTLKRFLDKECKVDESTQSKDQSFNLNYDKYIHSFQHLTKVNSPAFERKTTYLTTNDLDRQETNQGLSKQRSEKLYC